MSSLSNVAIALLAAAPAGAQVRAPSAGVVPLTFEEANELAREPRWLSLRCAEFDTRGNGPDVPADLRGEALAGSARSCFLAQFEAPIGRTTRAAILATGVEILDYVPNNAFVLRGSGEARAALERLPITLWSGELHPAFRLDPALLWMSQDARDAESPRTLTVAGFAGGDAQSLARSVAASGATILERYEEFGRPLLRIDASAAIARRLACANEVQWVEPASSIELRNNNTAWVIQTNLSNLTRVWDKGLHGEGQVIGHIDAPFSSTVCWFKDPTNAPVGPTHRKLVYLNASGVDNHGTHTACTAAGDAEPISGSTFGRGMAYLAKLAHTDVPVGSFANVATTHSQNGARIHTNSWGDDTTTAYNALCVSIDGYQWNHEDELVFFAISNSPTVTNPDNSKNIVTVGATQNSLQANNYCIGGTGPTPDGRRKPDVMAPGCSIVSGVPGACTTLAMTGTSMAAPAAAGAGALVRQYFESGLYPSGIANPADAFTPSGALVKALLVNCAQDVTNMPGYPGPFEGWGRLNLDESLHFVGDASKLFATEKRRANGLDTGDDDAFTLYVQSSAPFEVTLAFTDAPGTLNASNPVVNDLDLEVTSPSGVLYRGNDFAGGWSATGGVADAKNNVERVALAAPELGAWTVRVRAASVPQGPQGYGLCATGDLAAGGTSSPTSYCTAGQSSNFCSPVITTSGVARASASSGFLLAAKNLEGQRPGVIFYGTSGRVAVPWWPGSSSFQCVRQPLQRTGTQNSAGTSGGCDGLLFVDWSAWIASHPGAVGTPVASGQLIDAQAWYRDPASPGQSNLSNAVEFTVQP